MPLNHSNSPGGVIQTVYDKDNDSLRVTLSGSGSPTLPNTVRLSDGVGYLTSTVAGAQRALDVNVIGTGLSIIISHTDDSIRLGDGTNYITSTTSGAKTALDVNLLGGTVTTTPVPAGPTVTTFGSISALAPASNSITATYTVPVGKTDYIQKVYISGTQVGTYTIRVNTIVFLKYRTSVTKFSEIIDLSTGSAFGKQIVAGDTVDVVSENNGSVNGDFDVTIQVMET